MPLGGDWMVSLDPDFAGMKQRWYSRLLEKDARPIRLPGTLDGAGYGTLTKGRWWRYLNRVVEYIGPGIRGRLRFPKPGAGSG